MRRIPVLIAIICVVVAATFTGLTLALADENKEAHPPHVERPVAGVPAAWLDFHGFDFALWLAGAQYAEALMRDEYIRVAATNEYIRAAAAYAAALARQRQPVVRRSSGSGPVRQTTGECSSIAAIIGDRIVQRESGGNPSAKNPSSDAYGCAQTLLSHYSRGSCQGLDPYTIEGQRQCVLILSNNGTNLQPWSLG